MKRSRNNFMAIAGASVLSVVSIGVAGFNASGSVSAAEVCNPGATTIDAAVCMQDINDSIIDSMALDEQYQLTDVRDGRTYYVVKLKDGNVWMSQNLKLYLNNEIALTSETSDLNDNISDAYQDGYSIEDGVIKWLPANTTMNFNYISVSGWVMSNTVPHSASMDSDTGTGHESYGNYYNWSSSIASNNSTAFSESTLDDITKNPQNSICPKRWRLPTISNQSATEEGTTNEFARLNQLYNDGALDTDEKLLVAPLYLMRAGYIRFGLHSFGTAGFYWSDTIDSTDTAFYLGFHSSSVTPSSTDSDDNKSFGHSVRCIARIGFSADTSDDTSDEDGEGAISAPDTGANLENSDFSNGSAPILGILISGIVAMLGFLAFHKRAEEDEK